MSNKLPDIDITSILNELPPLTIPVAEFKKEMKKIIKNTSIRLSLSDPIETKIAVLLAHLTLEDREKKATLLKEWVRLGILEYFRIRADKMTKTVTFVSTIASGSSPGHIDTKAPRS